MEHTQKTERTELYNHILTRFSQLLDLISTIDSTLKSTSSNNSSSADRDLKEMSRRV